MNSIRVIYSFARSGGTLVNRLLGVCPGCSVLSEVNPAASVVPVARQALEWLGLIDVNEIGQFQDLSYAQQISLLVERAQAKRKKLIIRDWVTVNFLPQTLGDMVVPSGILEQPIYLADAGFSIQPLVITRKAKNVYRSIRHNFVHMENLSVKDFGSAYLAYAHAVSEFPKVSLEALQTSPREALIQVMQELGLSIGQVDRQLETFSDFNKCTGDNTLAVPSKTAQARNILPTENTSEDDKLFSRNSSIAKANQLLGYQA